MKPGRKIMEFGSQAANDEEILATILSTGIKGKSALAIAKELLEKYGSLFKIVSQNPHELAKIKGIGKVKISRLLAAFELAKRLIKEAEKKEDFSQLNLFLNSSSQIYLPQKDKINIKGTEWTKLSISIWNNIQKNREERSLKHPAIFPLELVRRLIKIFTKEGEIVLDPFVGCGSSIIGAVLEGRSGIGFEIVPQFAQKAKERIEVYCSNIFQKVDIYYFSAAEKINFNKNGLKAIIYNLDARQIDSVLPPSFCDLIITSPPYANILTRKRTADYKEIKKYSNLKEDLGNIPDYSQFLSELTKIFASAKEILKPNKYFIVIVMDLRIKDRFIPYHIDVVDILNKLGLKFCDIIIWDRRNDYNNLRPLGYPYKFIVNKIHEYILIFQKR
jgi:DNA modification methylase